MVWRKLLAGSLTLGIVAGTVHAGGIFNRKKPPEPPKQNEAKADDQIGELVRILRGDPDERKRATAAGELSKVDFKSNPQAGYALIESLQQDPSVNVRSAAATSLSKLRPLTLQAGQALEAALDGDQSPRVRLAARTSLQVFLQNGYRVAGNRATPADNRANPAVQLPAQPAVAKRPPVKPAPTPARPATLASRNQSNEPPLADAAPSEPIAPAQRSSMKPSEPSFGPVTEAQPESNVPKPYKLKLFTKEPSATPAKPATPAAPPKPAKDDDEGPILNPPG